MHETFGIQEILETIQSLLTDPGVNCLGPDVLEPAWGSPLLGVSRGDDPLYAEFQETIGPFHWTPLEAFCTDALAFCPTPSGVHPYPRLDLAEEDPEAAAARAEAATPRVTAPETATPEAAS